MADPVERYGRREVEDERDRRNRRRTVRIRASDARRTADEKASLAASLDGFAAGTRRTVSGSVDVTAVAGSSPHSTGFVRPRARAIEHANAANEHLRTVRTRLERAPGALEAVSAVVPDAVTAAADGRLAEADHRAKQAIDAKKPD